jgi:hypothetical protein
MAHATLTSVSGGACVGTALQASIGNRDIFAALIQQSNTFADRNGQLAGQSDQLLLHRIGQRVRRHAEPVVLSGGACHGLPLRRRDSIRPAAGVRAHHRTSQQRRAGTSTSTWNVMAAGSTAPVSTVTLSAEFRWNMLGIPHNDFHVFDGSVLPGYVDGNIVIPEEVNPFCEKCGWGGSSA